MLANHLIPLCPLDEIAEEHSKGLTIQGIDVFIVKKDGILYAYRNQCPHLGTPLEMQEDNFLDLEKNFVQCATHGAIFSIEDGLCLAGPCQGQSLQNLALHIDNNQIYLDISSLNNPFSQ